jgi:abortive infection bacteriophage resistance protein
MPYAKPYRTIPDQLALIKGRGMGVTDDALAETYLNRIGYYRLSGYWYPYRRSHSKDGIITVTDEFRVGTKFSEIVDLYVFDKKLRLLMMDVIERIEIAFRVQITLQLGKRGAQAHRDPGSLHRSFTTRADPLTGETEYQKWLLRQDRAFAGSKEEFAKHFKAKYTGENPPIWIAAELWDFGSMSILYSGMKKDDQTAVANNFGISSFIVMASWLRNINVARNICAHHSRFWNKSNANTPVWPSNTECPDLGHIERDERSKSRVYGLACICVYLLRTINPNSGWIDRLKVVMAGFPKSDQISISSAGFPEDWEKANLWH